MKKKSLLILLLILTLCVSLFMTACGGSSSSDSAAPADAAEEAVDEAEKTLEDMNAEENFLDDIGYESGDDYEIEITIEGNDLIYTYDFSKNESVTEEAMKDPVVADSLQQALDTSSSQFVDLVKELESQTGLTGVRVVVNYTWGEDILCTGTFDSQGLVE